MGRILVVLFNLISSMALAAQPGNAPILTIAAPGQNSQSLSIPLSSLSGTGVNGVFTINAGPGTGNTASNVMPFRKNGSLYQVSTSAGVKAYCMNVRAASATALSLFQLMSATVTFADNATTGSLTGAKYQGGVVGSYASITGPSGSVPAPVPGSYVFDNSSWPGIEIASSNNYYVSADCFEQ